MSLVKKSPLKQKSQSLSQDTPKPTEPQTPQSFLSQERQPAAPLLQSTPTSIKRSRLMKEVVVLATQEEQPPTKRVKRVQFADTCNEIPPEKEVEESFVMPKVGEFSSESSQDVGQKERTETENQPIAANRSPASISLPAGFIRTSPRKENASNITNASPRTSRPDAARVINFTESSDFNLKTPSPNLTLTPRRSALKRKIQEQLEYEPSAQAALTQSPSTRSNSVILSGRGSVLSDVNIESTQEDPLFPALRKCTDNVTSLCFQLAEVSRASLLNKTFRELKITNIGRFASLTPSALERIPYIKKPKVENALNYLKAYKPVNIAPASPTVSPAPTPQPTDEQPQVLSQEQPQVLSQEQPQNLSQGRSDRLEEQPQVLSQERSDQTLSDKSQDLRDNQLQRRSARIQKSNDNLQGPSDKSPQKQSDKSPQKSTNQSPQKPTNKSPQKEISVEVQESDESEASTAISPIVNEPNVSELVKTEPESTQQQFVIPEEEPMEICGREEERVESAETNNPQKQSPQKTPQTTPIKRLPGQQQTPISHEEQLKDKSPVKRQSVPHLGQQSTPVKMSRKLDFQHQTSLLKSDKKESVGQQTSPMAKQPITFDLEEDTISDLSNSQVGNMLKKKVDDLSRLVTNAFASTSSRPQLTTLESIRELHSNFQNTTVTRNECNELMTLLLDFAKLVNDRSAELQRNE